LERQMLMLRKNQKICVCIVSLILMCITILGCLSGCNGCVGGKMATEDYEKVTNIVSTDKNGEPIKIPVENASPDEPEFLAVNPINFDELTDLNPDLYAWLEIPGTAIDNPVAQSTDNDQNYYLHHNYLGNYEFAGTIYSQRHNTRYFIDRVTVLYGHNMLNGTMFADLHKFSDKDFFEDNDEMFIYIDGHILTYKIFAAYEYDDRHILNSFDFSKDEVYEQYLKDCLNPHSSNSIVREGVTLTKDDRILTLSTCTNYNSNKRFLVQGVLINDEKTQ